MNNTDFLKQLMSFYRPFMGKFFISWLFLCLFTSMGLAFPYTIGKIIDSAVTRDAGLIYMWISLGLGFLIIGRIVALYFGQVYELNNLDYAIETKLRRDGLKHLNKLSVGQHQNQNSGLKQDIVLSGCDSLQTLSSMIINNLSFMVINVIIGLTIFMFHSPVLAIINAISLVIYLGASIMFNKLLAPKLEQATDLRNDSQKKYTDYIRSITLLILNSNEKTGMKAYERSRKKFESKSISYWKKFVGFMRIGDFLEIINTAVVLLYSVNLYLGGSISVGEITVYLFWSKMITGSMGNFNNLYRQLVRMTIDAKKYFHLLQIEPEIKPPQNEVAISRLKGDIRFKDVYFKYPVWSYFEQFEADKEKKSTKENHQVLENINIHIKPKEKVAFVGMSGAGKSTLVSLLMRAYDPQSGKILVDDIDIRDLDPQKLRKNIGLVEQDIQLMDDTLRTNLLIGLNGDSESTSDEELWQVMRKANIDKFEDKLTDGLDTKIGERGVKLSGGERQRVAIARALLRKAPIIIFDEATSSLDGINEQEIHEAMFKAGEDSSCIFIAHRLATVKDVDRIFVLDKGQVVDEGKHDELVKRCEVYKQLVERQVVAFY